MSQLVPSLMGPVTISALLNGDYSDEKKEKKANGTSVTIRAQAPICGALIGAQKRQKIQKRRWALQGRGHEMSGDPPTVALE